MHPMPPTHRPRPSDARQLPATATRASVVMLGNWRHSRSLMHANSSGSLPPITISSAAASSVSFNMMLSFLSRQKCPVCPCCPAVPPPPLRGGRRLARSSHCTQNHSRSHFSPGQPPGQSRDTRKMFGTAAGQLPGHPPETRRNTGLFGCPGRDT